MQLLRELKEGFSHIFYPDLCEGCRKPLVADEEVLCTSCETELPETGYHDIPGNETELRFSGRIPFHRATTLAYFTDEGLLQLLLHGLKYRSRRDIGLYLGNALGRRLAANAWAKDIDIIIPVPLHKKKERERGYNQSQLIATGISRQLHIPAADGLLVRTRHTESQTRKSRAERVNNMEGAFVLKNKEKLAGKHILLCDDVLTTGATLEACAHALQGLESIKISIATIGIAVS